MNPSIAKGLAVRLKLCKARWTTKVIFVLAMTLLSVTGGAAVDDSTLERQGAGASISLRTTWQSHSGHYLRRQLEDAAGYYYDEANDDGADNDGEDNDDNALMNIEQDMETALTDMFYSPPSEWTGKHWAFFAGMVTIVAIAVGLLTACIVSSCIRSRGKPISVKTQEEHDHYTDALMRDDDGPLSDATDEHTDEDAHKYRRHGKADTVDSDYSHSEDYDSGFYSTEEDSSFDDEYIRKRLHRDEYRKGQKEKDQKKKSQKDKKLQKQASPSSDFELTTSHVDYNGPNRRQLC